MSERAQVEAQRDQALADLEEVAAQVADGEVDAATGERLGAIYRAEVAAAEERLQTLDEGTPPAPKQGRSRGRLLAGAGVLLVGGAALVFAVTQAVEPRAEGGIITGGVPVAPTQAFEGRDPSEVSTEEMEAVVAANPDIIPMRLALARRYMEANDFSAALPHYLDVLEQEPNAEALSYVGWMSYLSGEVDLGARYLERALTEDPNFGVGLWFLANLRIDGQDDPRAAIPLLERLLADQTLPDDVRAQVQALLAEAEAS